MVTSVLRDHRYMFGVRNLLMVKKALLMRNDRPVRDVWCNRHSETCWYGTPLVHIFFCVANFLYFCMSACQKYENWLTLYKVIATIKRVTVFGQRCSYQLPVKSYSGCWDNAGMDVAEQRRCLIVVTRHRIVCGPISLRFCCRPTRIYLDHRCSLAYNT